MRWFKHYTDAFDDEGFDVLMDQFGGLEGYGIFWRVVEMVAKQMDGSDRCEASYSIKTWCRKLGVRTKKFDRFLAVVQQELNFHVEKSDKSITVRIPKLLSLRDEWSRKQSGNSGAAPARRSQIPDPRGERFQAGGGVADQRLSEPQPGTDPQPPPPPSDGDQDGGEDRLPMGWVRIYVRLDAGEEAAMQRILDTVRNDWVREAIFVCRRRRKANGMSMRVCLSDLVPAIESIADEHRRKERVG